MEKVEFILAIPSPKSKNILRISGRSTVEESRPSKTQSYMESFTAKSRDAVHTSYSHKIKLYCRFFYNNERLFISSIIRLQFLTSFYTKKQIRQERKTRERENKRKSNWRQPQIKQNSPRYFWSESAYILNNLDIYYMTLNHPVIGRAAALKKL